MGGKILYMSNKRVGNGFKSQVYIKGNGVIQPSTLNRFGMMGQGIMHGVVPFVSLGEGVSERPKNISQRVRKLL